VSPALGYYEYLNDSNTLYASNVAFQLLNGGVKDIEDLGSISAITGTAGQGQTLTAGTITDADGGVANITYQWKADGINISGATSRTYAPTSAEVGKVLTVAVAYSDNQGSGRTLVSVATGPVAAHTADTLALTASGTTDTGVDNALSDGGTGEILKLTQLDLSASEMDSLQSLKFNSLSNLKLFSLATAGDAASTATEITDLAGTTLSRADIVAGKYLLKYAQSDEATVGRNAFGAYTVTDSSGTYNKVLDLAMSSASGAAVWGDESGTGGVVGGTAAAAGAGGSDTLLGTTSADILFGDGSGGGASDAISSGSAIAGGAGGGGADVILAGAGDDILFGDGFAGDTVLAASASGGAGGYGGGGGGGAGINNTTVGAGGAAGTGAGAGASTTNTSPFSQAGDASTLGNAASGSALTGTTATNTHGGAGAGVSADGNNTAGTNYVAELDSGNDTAAGQYNNSGSVASTVSASRAAFLSGTGSTMFTQTMGAGDDTLYGGTGADYIMGGNGNDTIHGGQGNDIVYGRGGGAVSGTDNDTFVWQRGDAGAGALDIVRDFTVWNGTSGDKLDLTQQLEGYTGSNLSQWVTVQTSVIGASLVGNGVVAGSWDANQTGTLLTIDVDGAGSGTATQRIFLADTTLSTDVNALKNSGLLVLSTDSNAPELQSVSANGAQVTLTYNKALDATTAAKEAFTVNVDGSSVTLSSATVSGNNVVLTLNTTPTALQSVTVSYNKPSSGNDVNAVQDLAGNDAASLSVISVQKPLALAATGSSDTGTDSVLSDGGTGEILQLSHMGLSDSQLTALQSLQFTSLSNLKLYSLATAGNAASTATEITNLAGTTLSRADIVAGKYLLKYAQSDEATAGRSAFAAYTVTDSLGTYSKVLDIAMGSASGAAVWGDESGRGGQGTNSNTANLGNGVAGAGGVDTLLGTAGADLVFGDGSGGGAGDATYYTADGGSYAGGAAGGGADVIVVGAGDDIVFGDGFTGSSTAAWSTHGSAGGYGGGGGGGAGLYSTLTGTGGAAGTGAGAGASTSATSPYSQAGGSATLGFTTAGSAMTGGTTTNTHGGAGAGVSADGNNTAGTNYVAEVDSGNNTAAGQYNNSGSVASTVSASRAAFLSGAGSTMFTQTMGAGNDIIYGGTGADYIMGGNGNDTIYGGQGNDIVYGRGGGAVSGTDNDTFVWQRGDAGAGALDIVRDFTAWNGTSGDKLDLTQQLEGYTGSNLSQWVTVQTGVTGASLVGNGVVAGSWDASQTGTLLTVDVDGAGSGTATQRIFLAGTTLNTDVNALKTLGVMAVSADNSSPQLQSVIANGTQVVLTYSESLDAATAAKEAFTVKVGGSIVALSSAVASGNQLVLTLAAPASDGQPLSVAYTAPAWNANAVQDAAGNHSPSFAETSVYVDANPPLLQGAELSSDGTQLILTYNNTLNPLTATADAFVVTVGGTSSGPSNIAVDGNTITLTLSTVPTNLQSVTVAYYDPSSGNDANAVQDMVGNDASSFTGFSVVKPLMLVNAATADVGTDNMLSDGGTGEILQLSNLGLNNSQMASVQSVLFTSMSNLKLYSLATAGNAASTATEITDLAGTTLSRADLVAGKYLLKYAQSDEATAGRTAFAAYTVTDNSSSYEKVLDLTMSTATGAVVWGDESGMGGSSTSVVDVRAPGVAGGGGADVLLGTTGADIVFGDGSGGGGGDGIQLGNNFTNFGGAAGAGSDLIQSGSGDDILFGDGFTGESILGSYWAPYNPLGGAGGYGGGGGGSAGQMDDSTHAAGPGGAAGVGAGAGGMTVTRVPAAATAGGASTMGASASGTAATIDVENNTHSGAGAGVSADGNNTAGTSYVAEIDNGNDTAAGQFNNTGSVASTVATARATFLSGTGSTMFTQTMGAGNDNIYGGMGNDYIMGGNGNDAIYGGQGNDIMYGRGGGAVSGRDADTLVWQRGDAGVGALDVVRDFSTGDVLDISGLIQGYTEGTSNLSQWVTVQTGVTGASLVTKGIVSGSWDANQTGTLLTIDVDGAGTGSVKQYIFLPGATLDTNVETLKDNGIVAVAASIRIQSVTDNVSVNGSVNAVTTNGATTDDNTPTLAGTLGAVLPDTQKVVVYETVNGTSTKLGDAVVNGANWTYDLPTLTQGSHSFKAVVENKLTGQELYSSVDRSLVVNTTALSPLISNDTGTPIVGEGRYLYIERDYTVAWSVILSEIAVYSNGVNIASQATVTSFDTTTPPTTTKPASNLIDGNLSNLYSSIDSQNPHVQWIQLDFGEVRTFETVTLFGNNDPAVTSFIEDTRNLSLYVGNSSMAGLSTGELSANGVTPIWTVPSTGFPSGSSMSSANPATTNDNTPTVSGTLTVALGSNEEVAIYDTFNSTTTKLGVATVGSNLQWSFTPTQTLADGAHSLKVMVQAKDDVSGTSGRVVSADRTVVVSTPTVPVVLDLNQDGHIGYTQQWVDLTGDGNLTLSAWAKADEGVLFADLNEDGQVNGAKEFAFGDAASGLTDLQGLAKNHDSNHDGVLNSQDRDFALFKVWQDINGDGVSQGSEVHSLSEVGIQHLNLLSNGQVQTPASGVTEYGRTTASLSDGSSMSVADAAFVSHVATIKTGTRGHSDVFTVESHDKLVKVVDFELAQPGQAGDQVDLSALMASLGATSKDVQWNTSGNDLVLQVMQAQSVSAAVVFADLYKSSMNTELLTQHLVL
jgi:uncharacterized repeat protein (TIGR02059 family)